MEEQQQNSEGIEMPEENIENVIKFIWGPERDMEGNIIPPKVDRPTDVDSFFYDESFKDYDPGVPDENEARTIDLQIQIDTSSELGKTIAKYLEELTEKHDNSLEEHDETGGAAEAPGPIERE